MKIALTIALALTSLTAGVLLADKAEADARTKIKSLQKDLIATLKTVVDVAAVEKSNERMTDIDALRIQRPLLDATLDASEMKPERISVLEKIVKLQKEIETLAEARHKDLIIGKIEVLQAKAARIKAEIALEREKGGDGK